MNAYLKIKITSLAAEATIIHNEERKFNIGSRGRKRIRRSLAKVTGLTEAQKKKLEFKLQPPSATAMEIFWGLRHHRVYDVREESRAALIAYGYLRGKTYKQIEQPKEGNEPNWTRVQKLIEKYGPKGQLNTATLLKAWREAV